MDRDELNKAAEEAAEKYINASYAFCNEVFDGFIQGASWLMQQPLADRLTDEEKERITDMYNNMESFRKCSTNPIMIGLFLALRTTVENIFGKDLFKEK